MHRGAGRGEAGRRADRSIDASSSFAPTPPQLYSAHPWCAAWSRRRQHTCSGNGEGCGSGLRWRRREGGVGGRRASSSLRNPRQTWRPGTPAAFASSDASAGTAAPRHAPSNAAIARWSGPWRKASWQTSERTTARCCDAPRLGGAAAPSWPRCRCCAAAKRGWSRSSRSACSCAQARVGGGRGGGRGGDGGGAAHRGLVLEAIVESDGDAALGGGADELARERLAVEGIGEESDEAKPGAEL